MRVDYIGVNSMEQLEDKIEAFYQESNYVKLIEINTSEVENSMVLDNYFKCLKKEIKL